MRAVKYLRKGWLVWVAEIRSWASLERQMEQAW